MSTYSPDLRIQLISTGDQAGTWGNTTNTNMGGIIENAIAGVQSVVVTATSQALTALYGAVDQAQGAVLSVTTTLSSNFSIFAPPNSKQYTIYNNTSYVLSIYVSTVLGNTTPKGTAISIPANGVATVWTDGTNFYPQNNYFPSAVNINGSVTATNHIGAGTGLTGTATSLSIGGNAATATSATSVTSISSSQQLAIIALAYPVGSIYMNTSNSTNPGTLLGIGTWAVVASGQMLLGNGGGYTAGNTGGSATTTLTYANMPSHSHAINDPGHFHADTGVVGIFGTTSGPDSVQTFSGTHNTSSATTGITGTATAGNGTAFTTISPYLVVYMWQRTA